MIFFNKTSSKQAIPRLIFFPEKKEKRNNRDEKN